MEIFISLIILITIIQVYIVWMTFKKWFDKNITYCKMKDSDAVIGTTILSFLCPIPILPIVAIIRVFSKKYLTIRWMF